MKILHVSAFYNEKYYYRINYYTDYLSIKHDVRILTSENDVYFGFNNPKKIGIGYFNEGQKTIVRKKVWFQLKDSVYFSYKKEIDLFKPDIVHLYEFRQFVTFLVARYCYRKGIPFVYEHEQKDRGKNFLGKLKNKIFIEYFLRNQVKNASKIISVTNSSLDHLESVVNDFNKEEAFLTTLAYNKNNFYVSAKLRNEFRESLNIKDDEILIGITGKFYTDKKVEVIINAVNESIKRNKNIKLLISGIGYPKYMALIKKLTNDHIILNHKFLNKFELNQLFNGCDYAIWTSPTNSYFEALGTGLKIIIPKGLATCHLVSDNIIFYGNKDTIYQPQENNNFLKEDDIYRELVEVISKLKKYSDRIPVEKFCSEKISKEIEQIYFEIVNYD